MKKAFEPIETKDSKILILGTMPGERSLRLQQYYGHAGNHFWKIMFALLNEPFTDNYTKRVQLLQEKKIAVWDVLSHCEGNGSADSNIKNEKANDFKSFYKKHPDIKRVFFASKKAEHFYDKYVGKNKEKIYSLLPSTSRANTWKSFDQKLEHWKEILNHL